MKPFATQVIAAIALLFLTSACGGGGGNSPVAQLHQPVQDPDPQLPTDPPPPDDPDPEPEPDPDDSDDTIMTPNPEPAPEPPVVPPAPSGVTVSAGISTAIVSWDNPFASYDEHGLAYIYRSTSNNFSSATRIGTSRSFLYTDENLQSETTYYYWVVWESEDGQRGPASSPVHDTTAVDPNDFPTVQPPSEDEQDETEPDADTGALEGPATLESVGTTRQAGTTQYSEVNIGGRFQGTFSGTRPYHSFSNWGLWAKVGSATLFRVDIQPATFPSIGYTLHIEGGKSLSNPVSGSAVWIGGVRAYEAHPDTYGTPVTATARMEVDFTAATMDVDFTGFSGRHANLSWDGLRIDNGQFHRARGAYNEITGAFYGADHQGVAGRFTSPRLDGVFGATRD